MDSEFLNGLGKRISARRKSLNLSQEQLAEEIDVSVQTISNLECGRKAVRLPKLVKISQLLNISCDYLLTGKYSRNDYSDLSAKMGDLDDEDFFMVETIINHCLDKKSHL